MIAKDKNNFRFFLCNILFSLEIHSLKHRTTLFHIRRKTDSRIWNDRCLNGSESSQKITHFEWQFKRKKEQKKKTNLSQKNKTTCCSGIDVSKKPFKIAQECEASE